MLCCLLSRSVMSDSLRAHGLEPARLLCPLGFSRQEHWSGLPCPPAGDLPSPGIQPRSPALQADSLPAESSGKPKNTGMGSLSLLWNFPTQELNRGVLHWQADSLPTELPRKPTGRGNTKIPIRKVSYILHFRVDCRL